MKTLLLSLFTFLLPSLLMGQDYEGFDEYNLLIIKDSKFEILAERSGKEVIKSTKEIHVKLSQATGAFYCGVQQKDLQLFTDEELPEDMDRPERPYFVIKGTMPMNQILGSDNTDQQYKVEMRLSVFEQEIPLVFQVNVKNYQQTSAGFWIFIGTADLDTRDLGITEFHGYNPEITIVFSFQAFKKGT
jgi:hypothetical protein